MRIKWITFIAISLIMIGCVPQTQIQKIHIRVDQQNTGEVDIFTSFDEIGRSHKKVAELKVTDKRPLNEKNRNVILGKPLASLVILMLVILLVAGI